MQRLHQVHLVDASPYIFRAFHSLPSTITDGEGRPVGAVYGFAGFLLKLIHEEDPTHLGLAFDASLTISFRNGIYPPYRQQREEPPEELQAQLDDCRGMAEALGAATFVCEGYEAEDLIGTLCSRLETLHFGAVVVSSDKDLAQLVSDRVSLLDYAKDRRYTPAEVEERFGVQPRQIPDLFGLAGDKVDNIPGVPGIGQKTAASLLVELGDLETLYERLDDVARLDIRGAASLRRKLEAHREQAFLSKRLATIVHDAPLEADIDELAFAGAEVERVDPLFHRLGFEGLRDRIRRWRTG